MVVCIAGINVPVAAIAFAVGKAQASGQDVVRQHGVADEGRLAGIQVPEPQRDVGAVFERRLARDDVHRAGDRVLPEQRALRPAQDLHPVDIHQVVEGEPRARAIDAVDERAYRSFQARVVPRRAHAANAEVAPVGRAVGAVHREGRRHLLQPVEVRHAPSGEILSGVRGNGYGNVLNRRFALGRGNENLFDDGLVRILPRHGSRQRQHKQAGCDEEPIFHGVACLDTQILNLHRHGVVVEFAFQAGGGRFGPVATTA